MSKEMTFKVHVVRGAHGAVHLREGRAPEPVRPAIVPSRVARLVAQAHRIDGLIRAGRVRDQTEVAVLAGLTRGRVSQIVDLLLLAPDIQEALLFLDRPTAGREPLGEVDLRKVIREPDWAKQRAMFKKLIGQRGGGAMAGGVRKVA